MQVSVYGAFNYDRGSKIRWLMTEAGEPFQNEWLDLQQGGLESEAFLRINPLGRIPAVKIDDRVMIESNAIVSYLADRLQNKGLAPALTAPERMDFQQWMYYSVSIDSFTTRISIIEDIPAGEVATDKMTALIGEVKDFIDYLGNALVKKEFLTGQFTAADICMGYHLYISTLWPEFNEIIEGNANVSAYLKRLKSRPAAITAKVFSYEG